MNQFVDVTSHNLVEGHARDDLQVLISHDLVRPFHCQPLVVPNTRQTGINFLLPFVGHPQAGVGISLTEVAREAVLTVSELETIGVTEASGVAEGPFHVTHTVFFPRLDSSSCFFVLIFA